MSGGNATIQSDVRVVAATNQDLDAQVAAGKFRRDLLYRLNGSRSACRRCGKRLDDIPDLIRHFIRLSNRKHDRDIRSARAAVVVGASSSSTIGPAMFANGKRHQLCRGAGPRRFADTRLPTRLPALAAESSADRRPIYRSNLDIHENLFEEMLTLGSGDIYRRVNDAVDRAVIERVMRHVQGNQVQAADRLGISRTTLRTRLQALDIRTPEE